MHNPVSDRSIICPGQKELHSIDLGLIPYQEGLRQQEIYRQKIISRQQSLGYLLLNEHPPTITLGKRGNDSSLRVTSAELKQREVELFHIDRGGEATFHGPGQIVVYGLLPLAAWRIKVKDFVDHLVQAMVTTSQFFGIPATSGLTSQKPVGAWVENRKIGSVGIRIVRGISMHGLAFNLCPDLNYFKLINPCGLCDTEMTSLDNELKRWSLPIPHRQEVARQLLHSLFTIIKG